MHIQLLWLSLRETLEPVFMSAGSSSDEEINVGASYSEPMRWNDLFADLESQLEFGQWEAVEQDAAELTRGMWAELTLMDRLRAALGQRMRLMLRDGHSYTLLIRAVGPAWVGGVDDAGALLMPREAILSVDGDLRRAVVPRRPLQAGPKMGAVYRMLARRREPVQIAARHGRTIAEGTIDRVGRDHLDLALHARDEFRRDAALRGLRIVPFEAIQLVRASPRGLDDI